METLVAALCHGSLDFVCGNYCARLLAGRANLPNHSGIPKRTGTVVNPPKKRQCNGTGNNILPTMAAFLTQSGGADCRRRSLEVGTSQKTPTLKIKDLVE